MRKRQFEALGRELLAHLPGFFVSGALIACRPASPVLRGIYLDGSRFSKEEFNVEIFFMPLYVPTEHIYFNFGGRIDRPGSWRSDAINLVSHLLEAIEDQLASVVAVTSPRAVAENLEARFGDSSNIPIRRARAYSWARAGEYDLAAEALRPLVDLRTSVIESVRTAAAQAEQFLSGLSDPVATQSQLDSWQVSSIDNLGLRNFVDS